MGIGKRGPIFGGIILFSILLIGGYWIMNRGYGEISPAAYELSKALYSACLKKSDEHLSKVEELLAEADDEILPAKERRWIEGIIALARSGQWESAAKKARRMMEDQVQP